MSVIVVDTPWKNYYHDFLVNGINKMITFNWTLYTPIWFAGGPLNLLLDLLFKHQKMLNEIDCKHEFKSYYTIIIVFDILKCVFLLQNKKLTQKILRAG